MVPVFVLLFLLLGSSPSLFDLRFLLVYQERLHRVIVVVVAHQKCQLSLLWQLGPRFLLAGLILGYMLALLAHDVLPANLELVLVLIVAGLVSRVVHPYKPAADLCATNVIDCQVGAPLVLILQPAEALGLAGLLVAHEFDEYGLAELGEYGDYVAFGEFVGEAAKVDVGSVAVVRVPGCIWRAGWASVRHSMGGSGLEYLHAVFDLLLIERLDSAYLVHGLPHCESPILVVAQGEGSFKLKLKVEDSLQG